MGTAVAEVQEECSAGNATLEAKVTNKILAYSALLDALLAF